MSSPRTKYCSNSKYASPQVLKYAPHSRMCTCSAHFIEDASVVTCVDFRQLAIPESSVAPAKMAEEKAHNCKFCLEILLLFLIYVLLFTQQCFLFGVLLKLCGRSMKFKPCLKTALTFSENTSWTLAEQLTFIFKWLDSDVSCRSTYITYIYTTLLIFLCVDKNSI